MTILQKVDSGNVNKQSNDRREKLDAISLDSSATQLGSKNDQNALVIPGRNNVLPKSYWTPAIWKVNLEIVTVSTSGFYI